jgi:hypothetical protein
VNSHPSRFRDKLVGKVGNDTLEQNRADAILSLGECND